MSVGTSRVARVIWCVALVLLVVLSCAKVERVLGQGPGGLGLGVCHWCPGGLDPAVGWCTETSAGRGVVYRNVRWPRCAMARDRALSRCV